MQAAKNLKSTQTSIGAAPAQIVSPTSPSEISAILRNPKNFPGPVRPMGFGSSTTRCLSAPGGTIVDMSGMNRVLRIDADSVTVQPGIAIRELAEILEAEGQELYSGFDLANRSVGGAVCSAGLEAAMGGDPSQFAAHVTSLRVVAPDGHRYLVQAHEKPLLGLMRLSYGLLGIVYEVTLKTRPIQMFTVQSARVGFKDFTKLAPRLTKAASGAKLYLMPFRDRVFIELRRPTSEPVSGRRLAWRFKDWACYSALPSALRSLAKVVPIRRMRYPLSDTLSHAAQSLVSPSLLRAGSNSLEQTGRFRHPGSKASFTYCTWAFPAETFGTVAAAYRDLCLDHYNRTGFRCDMPAIAFRMNQDRSALLGPSFDGPMFTISSLTTEQNGWDDFVFDLAEFAAAHAGAPFFNQTPGAVAESTSRHYGSRLAAFRKSRRRLDLRDRLLNQFFAGYLA
jgi:hypothetical protein